MELSKVQLQDKNQKLNTQRVLRYVLERTLRLLHPIMPHITEKIWGLIPGCVYKDGQKAIIKAKYPEFDEALVNEESTKQIELVIEAIKGLRNVRQSLNIAPSLMMNINILSTDEKETFNAGLSYIKRLARIENSEFDADIPKQSASAVVGNSKIIVPLEGLIDIDKETARQKKKLEKLNKELQGLTGRMKNKKFVDNAPEDVIAQSKARIEEIEGQVKAIDELLTSLVG